MLDEFVAVDVEFTCPTSPIDVEVLFVELFVEFVSGESSSPPPPDGCDAKQPLYPRHVCRQFKPNSLGAGIPPFPAVSLKPPTVPPHSASSRDECNSPAARTESQ